MFGGGGWGADAGVLLDVFVRGACFRGGGKDLRKEKEDEEESTRRMHWFDAGLCN